MQTVMKSFVNLTCVSNPAFRWYAFWLLRSRTKKQYLKIKLSNMKAIRLFSILAIAIAFASCAQLQQATNTTVGSVFSLNGRWQLESSTPENTLVGTVVTVTPVVSTAKITTLAGNTQCYRENDIKWKNIKADGAGGYKIDNLLSNCNSGSLIYQTANIVVVSNTQIRVTGLNAAGQDNTQTWNRIK
jgi:hypothetical protein